MNVKNTIIKILQNQNYINFDLCTIGGKFYTPDACVRKNGEILFYYWTYKDGILIYFHPCTTEMEFTKEDEKLIFSFKETVFSIMQDIEQDWCYYDPDLYRICGKLPVMEYYDIDYKIEFNRNIDYNDAIALIVKEIKNNLI